MINRIEKIDGLTIQTPLSSDEKLESPGPYTALIRNSIDQAIEMGASDIHFETTSDGVQIRTRVNGVLEAFYISNAASTIGISPRTLKKSFLMELKRISNLSLGKFGVAQDSRISFSKRGIEVRVNLTPTVHGEKVVYRLFFKNRNFILAKSGLPRAALDDIQIASSKSSGLIILSGETGSGKTTTLYSILESIDREHLNVASLEDPVEYILPGVNHTQVSERFGFADGLRALLRQDPDVILVGEIRDSETAKLVNRAAQTGHLVLTTVHTNRALSIPAVFEFYGVKGEEVVPNILLGANQRLLRTLCPECSEPSTSGEQWIAKKQGCSTCRAGFLKSRQIVFEYFVGQGSKAISSLALERNAELLRFGRERKIDYNEIQDHLDLRPVDAAPMHRER